MWDYFVYINRNLMISTRPERHGMFMYTLHYVFEYVVERQNRICYISICKQNEVVPHFITSKAIFACSDDLVCGIA